jgi:hypothetical protein
MFNYKGNPMLINVLFSGNQAVFGGGFYSNLGSATLVNTTFSGNKSSEGGAIFVNSSSISLTNAIIWGNSSAIEGNVAPVVTNSIVQGGYTGNLDIDPLFVNPVLYTSAPSTAGDYHLRSSSPAIDVGNDSAVTSLTDLDGNLRKVNTVDLGAYEWQAYNLTVNKVGNGSVTINPDQNAYGFGEEVTLTALGDSDWNFMDWSGDVVSSENEITLTMTKDTTLIAHFIKSNFKLFLPLIVR